ncbi:unnamed protein product [Mucor fragilis]
MNSSETENNDPHRPLTTHAGYSTFPQQQYTELTMAHSPQPALLSQLKNQSAFIQCPHCLKHVYTKINGADFTDVIFIFALVHFLWPLDVSYMVECLITASAWLVLWFMYTGHDCPSCRKKIATYNAIRRAVSITAPAITTPAGISDPPPLYSS